MLVFHCNSITSCKSKLTYPFGREADVKRISFMHRSETVMLRTANRGWLIFKGIFKEIKPGIKPKEL